MRPRALLLMRRRLLAALVVLAARVRGQRLWSAKGRALSLLVGSIVDPSDAQVIWWGRALRWLRRRLAMSRALAS